MSPPWEAGSGSEGQGWRHKTHRGLGSQGFCPKQRAWLLLEKSQQDLKQRNDTPARTFGEGLSASEEREEIWLGMKRLEVGSRWEDEKPHTGWLSGDGEGTQVEGWLGKAMLSVTP